MSSASKRWLIRGGKLAVMLAILAGVGWQINADLRQLEFHQLQLRPEWMLASAITYLVALSPSPWYWRHLHQRFGYPLPLYAAYRAHYIGQLGKYVPGKALAILIRAGLTHPYGVPTGVSIIASFYEVFTSLTAASIVAALVYMVEPPGEWHVSVHPMWIGVGLLGLCGVPLLPGVFNFVIGMLTKRIQAVELYRLPPIRMPSLAAGLVVNAIGVWLQGLSWWMMLNAVLPTPPELTGSLWAQCTASIAFANVVGFASGLPGGLGVREVLLRMLLSSLGEVQYISWAAIVLRLTWIAAETLFALCTYCVKPASPGMSAAIAGGE